MKLDDNLGKMQQEKLSVLRKNRDAGLANESMDNIRSAAQSGENLFPLVIQAVKNDCTLGEIMEAMKDVFGTWMAPSGF
ncbi:MAG: hypothetical protein CM15mP8_3490 [Methanobacteriota archaeon]|nr:MAG: hypothetical protein CM15mP8_3490 [Euryarchaeota archaeon]